MKKNVLIVFGTRPEAVKMCPLITELKKRDNINTVVLVSGQHGELLYNVLAYFGVTPDYDLGIMKKGQTLVDITAMVLKGAADVIKAISPDLVIVHGDTSTAYAGALAGFLSGIPVGHVEAGLRTDNIMSPYPEEFNRRSVSLISSYDFAPTKKAYNRLISEGKSRERVFLTGNTVNDALKRTVSSSFSHPLVSPDKRLIMLTVHRREKTVDSIAGIISALARISAEYTDVTVLYPVHKNPGIIKIAEKELSLSAGNGNFILSEPLGVYEFHNLLMCSCLVVTDSGGVQEEAAYLGVPALVVRDETERQEAVEAGVLRLIGTESGAVYSAVKRLLDNDNERKAMAHKTECFGQGDTSLQISDIIERI